MYNCRCLPTPIATAFCLFSNVSKDVLEVFYFLLWYIPDRGYFFKTEVILPIGELADVELTGDLLFTNLESYAYLNSRSVYVNDTIFRGGLIYKYQNLSTQSKRL